MSSIEMGLTVGEPRMKGWPYTDFATGWYQIGYSVEVAVGDIKAGKWLNQEVVIFRTESGELAVLDAYCPHMGAHLGRRGQFGGKVCGETIECPWHGWKWDTSGKNTEIPYKPGSTVTAEVPKKHVSEVDGCIMMWYDHAGRDPLYQWDGLPYVDDKSNYYPIDFTFDGPHLAKPQFPMENSADPHHFPFVHGSGLDAEFNDYVVDGHKCGNTMTLMFGAGKESSWMTPNGPVEGKVDSFFWGASIGIARFRIEDMVCIHMTNVTPIDNDRTIFFSTVTASKEPGDTSDEPKGRSGKMMAAQHWQIRNDFHIWQHMTYRVKPIFTGKAEQTRYAFIRRHFDQFYPNPVYSQSGES